MSETAADKGEWRLDTANVCFFGNGGPGRVIAQKEWENILSCFPILFLSAFAALISCSYGKVMFYCICVEISDAFQRPVSF